MYRTMILAACITAACTTQTFAVETDSDTVKALEQKISDAYKVTKAMVVTSTVSIELGGQKDEEEVKTRFAANGDVEIVTPNFDVIAQGGYFYMTIRGVDEFYLRRPLGDGVAKTMADVFMTDEVVPWVVALQSGDLPNAWIDRMTFGVLPNPRITGVKSEERELDGVSTSVEVLELTSARGAGMLHVSSATGEILLLEAAVSSPSGPADIQATLNVKIDTSRSDALKPEITFDAGSRKMVESLEDMLPQKQAAAPASDLAPDFTLPQLNGLEVTLSSLRGKIVVLDFWATWCGPCKRGLPLVQKFADWANENHADDIVVYAVNVWERGNSQSAIDQMVESFWEKNQFTMPTLISYSRKITQDYGVSGIPVTVVIDQDGKIAVQHRGYSPALFDELKSETQKLLPATP